MRNGGKQRKSKVGHLGLDGSKAPLPMISHTYTDTQESVHARGCACRTSGPGSWRRVGKG